MTRLLFRLLTFLLVPSVALYSIDTPAVTIQIQSVNGANLPLPNDYLFSYDDILDLIEELEEGNLERRCTAGELSRINQLLACLARAGILPDASSQELERDIEDLLTDSHENAFSRAPTTHYSYVLTPAFLSGHSEILLCKKGWFHKTWDQSKKFVKKHKKAILIGIAVVAVAAIAVYAVSAMAATATSSNSDKKDVQKTNSELPETISVQEVVEENVSSFKEIAVEDNLFKTSQNDPLFGEKSREVISYLAHEVLDGVGSLSGVVPECLEEVKDLISALFPKGFIFPDDNLLISGTPKGNWDSLIDSGHEKIDQIFSTDHAQSYTPEAKDAIARGRTALGINREIAILPPPGLLGESLGGHSGRIGATMASDVWGWRVGDSITNRTIFGTLPKWSTVRRRYWKNQAYLSPEKYEARQLQRMEQGLAPQRMNARGEFESMELHHNPSQREGGLFDFVEVWPDEHAVLDQYRHTGR